MYQHLFSVACGFAAVFVPNHKSNIHPMLLGVIFALLFTKIVFGDYDAGYQWSRNDLMFLVIVGSEGLAGAWMGLQLIQRFI